MCWLELWPSSSSALVRASCWRAAAPPLFVLAKLRSETDDASVNTLALTHGENKWMNGAENTETPLC